MIVKLNEEETQAAMAIGQANVERAVVGALRDFTNPTIDTLRAHQRGAAAEIAVAKALGLKSKEGAFSLRLEGDVGEFEVRSCSRGHNLILNARDQKKADRKFILVWCLGQQEFEIKGWAYGHEVMRPGLEFRCSGQREELWLLQWHRLRPLDTLQCSSQG